MTVIFVANQDSYSKT